MSAHDLPSGTSKVDDGDDGVWTLEMTVVDVNEWKEQRVKVMYFLIETEISSYIAHVRIQSTRSICSARPFCTRGCARVSALTCSMSFYSQPEWLKHCSSRPGHEPLALSDQSLHDSLVSAVRPRWLL